MKAPKPKTCKNPACKASFVPQRLGQAVCNYACGLAIKALQTESGIYCEEDLLEVPGIGSLIVKRPQSLSYDSMGEEVFQDFWAKVCGYLVLKDWPTLTEERLTEMAEFEGFREV